MLSFQTDSNVRFIMDASGFAQHDDELIRADQKAKIWSF